EGGPAPPPTREALTVHHADVEHAARAVEADVDGTFDVLRDAEVLRQEVRSAGRDDGDRGRRRCDGVDAALNHPVPTPNEEEIRAVGDRLLHLLRGLLALRDLVPKGCVDALPRENVA